MLVLTRMDREAIVIGHDLAVMVVGLGVDRVRLGIIAPPAVEAHRAEVYERLHGALPTMLAAELAKDAGLPLATRDELRRANRELRAIGAGMGAR